MTTKYMNWFVIAPDGTQHPLPTTAYTDRSDAGGFSCLNGSNMSNQHTIDGSGITITATTSSMSTNIGNARDGSQISYGKDTDPNGNTITLVANGFVDSMGLQVVNNNYNFVSGPFSWTDANGGSPEVSVTTTSSTLQSYFQCTSPSVADFGPTSGVSLPTGISFPDGTSMALSYEPTPGHTANNTGRIREITLREGGTITYTYTGGSSGVNCQYQTVPVLTRTLGNGDQTKYTLTYSLISGSAYEATNTVIDPGGNKTVYTFTGFTSTGTAAEPTAQVLTQVKRYQGSSTLLSSDVYCYNTAFSSCSFTNAPTATVTYPVTELVVIHKINGMSATSATDMDFDAYGNVTYSAQYDFGGSTPVTTTTATYGSCISSCTGSNPSFGVSGPTAGKPGWIVKTENGNTIADSRFTYDSYGHVLTSYVWNGTGFLSNSSVNIYNSNGTPSKLYDLAGNETDYTYAAGSYSACGSCTEYPFPTSVKNVGTGLTTSSTYNGTGGVLLISSDANANATTYCYTSGSGCSGGGADPYWRPLQISDPYGSTTLKSYPSGSSPDTIGSSFTFNSNNSISATTTTTDTYGRAVNTQKAQSPSGSYYDTMTTAYSWAGNYRTVQTSEPCSATLNGACTTVHSAEYDPLGRLYQESTTSNETVTHTYFQNDDLAVVTPAPAGENNKQVQKQYDGLGRLTSACKISSTVIGNISCGQNGNPTFNGILTTISYSSAAGSTTVSTARGAQARSQTFDAMGRIIRKVTPEGGSWTYTYDSNSSCPAAYVGAMGMLVSSKDSNGNLLCYAYDSMKRVIGVNADGTTCRHFYYDNSSGYSGTRPTGISLSNQYGRMVEAATDACASNTLITDEWFAYDKDGRVTDIWEKTPHSSQYYHSVATFFENGLVKTLQLASPSFYTVTYALDGEGRWNQLTDTTTGQNIVTGATFYPAANPSAVSLTGSDGDSYTFDTNTGNITQFNITVGSNSEVGSLQWNGNGTLRQLTIADGFNSGGTQTCHFNPNDASATGYDDVGRLVGVDCGNGQWGQTFSYDQYDNLTKAVISGRIGSIYNPGYSSTNNQCSICTFDADGDVTSDGSNTYGWNEFEKLKWTATSGTPTCGSSGECITYDALGRMVENSSNGAYNQLWFTQVGTTVQMAGSTINYGYFPTPKGGTAIINGNSAGYGYMHKDWLGNARIVSNILAHGVTVDQAFSPYGEIYDQFGSNNSPYDMFANLTRNFAPGIMWDTPNRELSFVGRWLSPDPASQGWNQYAYTTNPNSMVDPTGLGNQPGQGGYGNCTDDPFCGDDPNCNVSSPCGPGSTVPGPPMGCFDASCGYSGGNESDPGTSSSDQSSVPQLCYCSDDLISGVMAGWGGQSLPNLNDDDGSVVFLQGCTGAGIPCIAVLQSLQPSLNIVAAPDGSIIAAYRAYNYVIEDENGDPILSAESTEWIAKISTGSYVYYEGPQTDDNPLSDNVGFPSNVRPIDAFISAQAISVQIAGQGPDYLLNMTILHGAAMGNGIFSSFSNPIYWTKYANP